MSIQITKQDNFIKINISENVLWDEYRRCLKEFDEYLYDKIYMSVVDYDRYISRDISSDVIYSKVIYVFCSNNSSYAISSNKGITCINKRTIYDEKNPNTEDFGTGEEEITDFNKAFHINDKTICVYPEGKEYGLQDWRHGLYHKSTVDGMAFNSKSYFDGTLKYKNALLEMAQKLIEEIKGIENIETILDLSAFDIIPKPEVKRLINKKKD